MLIILQAEVIHMEGEDEQFLSPRVDYLFKRLFGNELATEPLISLLRAILHVNVTGVEIKNPELLRFTEDDKQGILDVRAVINGTEHVNIEMQPACRQAGCTIRHTT